MKSINEIMKTKIMCLLLLLSSPLVHSQDEKKLIEKMNKAYMENSSFSMDVAVRLFATDGDIPSDMVHRGRVSKGKNEYYSSMMGQTTVCNSRCYLVIDEENRRILYSSANASKAFTKPLADPSAVTDSLLKDSRLRTLSLEAGRRTIEIIPASSAMYDKIELTVNTANYALEKVVYLYKKAEDLPYKRVEMLYSNVSFAPKEDKTLYSEATYVSKQRGKLRGIGKWASYQVTDMSDFDPEKTYKNAAGN